MQNLSIFIKGNSDADYHRQQVGERGILEQIDFINNVLQKSGLTPDAIVEFYGILDRIETSLNANTNDPRTRRAMGAFEVPQTKKQAPAPVPENTPETPVLETTQSEPEPVPETNEEPITETTQSEPEPAPINEPMEDPGTPAPEANQENDNDNIMNNLNEPETAPENTPETPVPETTQSEPEPVPETNEEPAPKKRTKKENK